MEIKPEKLGQGVKFERIRRITGYLSGDTSTWCNAKKAELKDRIPHKNGVFKIKQ